MCESVLLPAPFSPSSACTSPTAASKSTRSLATTPGNRLVIPRRETAGATGSVTLLLLANVGRAEGRRRAEPAAAAARRDDHEHDDGREIRNRARPELRRPEADV